MSNLYQPYSFDKVSLSIEDVAKIISVDVENYVSYKGVPEDLANSINFMTNDEPVGAIIYIVNDGAQLTHITNDFYLTNFSFTWQEKAQLVEALTSSLVSFFDDKVKVYNFAGVAVDAGSTDITNFKKNLKFSSFLSLYNTELRGTKLVSNKKLAILQVANHKIYGYPLNINVNYNSRQDKVATFSMSWLVVEHYMDKNIDYKVSFNKIKYNLINYIKNIYNLFKTTLFQISGTVDQEVINDIKQKYNSQKNDLANKINTILNQNENLFSNISSEISEFYNKLTIDNIDNNTNFTKLREIYLKYRDIITVINEESDNE